MFGLRRAIFLVLVTAVVTCSAQDSRDQANTLVLVFKDGHQKSLAASEVSRIEFNPPRIVLKNGHQENFAAGEILRIEMNNGSAGVLGRNHFVGKPSVSGPTPASAPMSANDL